MKFLNILFSLLLSVFMGTIIGQLSFGSVEASQGISAILFVGSFIPKGFGILGNYVTVDVPKPNVEMPGYEPPKDVVIVFRADDVLNFPDRDDKGVLITNDVVLKPNANMMRIEVTQGTIILKGEPEGDNDSRGVIQSLEADAPSYALTTAEFFANNMNEALYAIVEYCDDTPNKLLGTPCAKLQMSPAFEGNNEKTATKMTLTSMAKGKVIAIYEGTLTFDVDFQVPAETVDIDVVQGDGRYALSTANTVPTEILSFVNGSEGQKVTLVGQGGVEPSTIQDGGNFIMRGGAGWTALDGSTITFEIYDDNHYFETFRN